MTKANTPSDDDTPSAQISRRIAQLGGWRGPMLAHLRRLIHAADADIVETWKWMGTPVWEHDGIVCTGESYKDKVKLTFARGAAIPDPSKLFNSSLDGNVRRALDLFEGDAIDEPAFKTLIRAAVAANTAALAQRAATKKAAGKKASKTTASKTTVTKKVAKTD